VGGARFADHLLSRSVRRPLEKASNIKVFGQRKHQKTANRPIFQSTGSHLSEETLGSHPQNASAEIEKIHGFDLDANYAMGGSPLGSHSFICLCRSNHSDIVEV